MIRTLASFLVLCFLACPAGAAVEKIEMQSEIWKEARGEALMEDLSSGAKEITVSVENLVPDSVYTVWFVNEEPRVDVEGVGDGGANSFRTDSDGKGVFKARVPGAVVEDWQKIEVAYHPGGDPMKISNLHIALMGELREKNR